MKAEIEMRGDCEIYISSFCFAIFTLFFFVLNLKSQIKCNLKFKFVLFSSFVSEAIFYIVVLSVTERMNEKEILITYADLKFKFMVIQCLDWI